MLTLNAPAKINWFLKVNGKRNDGYHEIESLMQCISLGDTLTFEHAEEIALDTDSEIPLKQNLVYKAAKLLKEKTSSKYGAQIALIKRIPMEAGLGGGSSDAAATLKGLNKLWGLELSDNELAEIGAELGSDVPFFIYGGSALVKGRGEIVERVDVSAKHHLVLVKPNFGVSAGWAYSNLEEFASEGIRSDDVLEAINSGDFNALGGLMKNDLEAPVINKHAVIGEIKKALLDNGAQAALMSGSGTTVFGVFKDNESALNAIQGLGEKYGPDHLVAQSETIPS